MPDEKTNSCCNYVNICNAYAGRDGKAHRMTRAGWLKEGGGGDDGELLPYFPLFFPYILEHSFLKCLLVPASGG